MTECNFFRCKNEKNRNCCISGDECNGSKIACIGFFGMCQYCKDASVCEVSTYKIQPVKEEEKKDKIVPYAYVDGSYNNRTSTYGYGVIIYDQAGKHVLQGNGSKDDLVSMRNVAGKIKGAMAAIQYAKDHGYSSLTIYYDYNGIECWYTGKWSANKEGTMKYRDFARNSGIKLNFIHTKAHTGIEGNEMADRLAKQAVGL